MGTRCPKRELRATTVTTKPLLPPNGPVTASLTWAPNPQLNGITSTPNVKSPTSETARFTMVSTKPKPPELRKKAMAMALAASAEFASLKPAGAEEEGDGHGVGGLGRVR